MPYLCLIVAFLLLSGCAVDRHVEEILFADGKVQKFAYYDETYGQRSDRDAERAIFMEALDILKSGEGGALPDLRDLPFKKPDKDQKRVPGRAYTGLIRNHTDEEVSFLSGNSGATLIVPAQGTLEYVTWKPTFQLIGYRRGKPPFAQKIRVEPRKYAFMEKKYDFLAEIKPEKPPVKKRPLRKRRAQPPVKPEQGPASGKAA